MYESIYNLKVLERILLGNFEWNSKSSDLFLVKGKRPCFWTTRANLFGKVPGTGGFVTETP
jgi:hypothetical protein